MRTAMLLLIVSFLVMQSGCAASAIEGATSRDAGASLASRAAMPVRDAPNNIWTPTGPKTKPRYASSSKKTPIAPWPVAPCPPRPVSLPDGHAPLYPRLPGPLAVLPTTPENLALVIEVRSGPSMADAVLGQIRAGSAYQIVGRTLGNHWLKIVCDEQEGWIAAEHVVVRGSLDQIRVMDAGTTDTPIVSSQISSTRTLTPAPLPVTLPTDTPIVPPAVIPPPP